MACAAAPAGIPRDGVAATGRRHLGSERPATAFHAFQGDGVGRGGPRREGHREIWSLGRCGTLEAPAGDDPYRGMPEGLRSGSSELHSVLWRELGRAEPPLVAPSLLSPRLARCGAAR